MYFNISTKKSPLFKGTHLPHFTTTSIPQPRDPKPCETMGNPNAGLFVFFPQNPKVTNGRDEVQTRLIGLRSSATFKGVSIQTFLTLADI